MSGLEEGRVYYFALVTLDEVGNRSAMSPIDTVLTIGLAPAAVTDLRITAHDDSSVTLAWTATGDDGLVGTPASYTLAASPSAIDVGNFDSAPVLFTRAATIAAGGAESQTLTGLSPGQSYHFRLRATDHADLQSGLSNEVLATTDVGGAIRGRVGIDVAVRGNPSGLPVTLDWQAANSAGAAGQSLSIHDLSGRLVRRLPVGNGANGSAQWDGRDGDGVSLRSGLYFVRLDSAGNHAQARLVLTR